MKEKEELEKILKKATSLFLAYGIKSVTMDDLARELAMSKKTLYTYFCDKEDLVNQAIDRELTEKQEIFTEIGQRSLNAIDELFEVNMHANCMLRARSAAIEYDLKKYFPDLNEKMFDLRSTHMHTMVLKNLKKGKAENLYREEIVEEIIAKLYVSRIMGLTANPMITIPDFTSAKFFTEIFTYHIRGIANNKGIEYFEKNKHRLVFEQYS